MIGINLENEFEWIALLHFPRVGMHWNGQWEHVTHGVSSRWNCVMRVCLKMKNEWRKKMNEERKWMKKKWMTKTLTVYLVFCCFRPHPIKVCCSECEIWNGLTTKIINLKLKVIVMWLCLFCYQKLILFAWYAFFCPPSGTVCSLHVKDCSEFYTPLWSLKMLCS